MARSTYEKLTVSNSVKTLTLAKYSGQQECLITAEATNGLRYTLDGTAPVAATTGHLLPGSGTLRLVGKDMMASLKMIREGGSDAVIHVTYCRMGTSLEVQAAV